MRIAMFLDTDFPPDPRVENEATALIKNGHEVYLFSLSYKPGLMTKEQINDIKVWRFKAGKLIYKFSALAYTVPVYHWMIRRKIKSYIKAVQPDVLHIHDMPIAKAVFDVNKEFDLPTVLDLHENRPPLYKKARPVNHWQSFRVVE